MGIIDKFFPNKKKIQKLQSQVEELQSTNDKMKSVSFIDGAAGYRVYNPIISEYFDGEKTPGELGNVVNTIPDFKRLRLRSHELNLKTDIVKSITNKFFTWVVGSGLKLQAQPNDEVLKLFGIKSDFQEFQTNVEALFSLYSKSEYSDYKREKNLHYRVNEAFESAFLGGDCLIVFRVDDVGVNVQVIDGEQVENPLDEKGKGKGNTITHGVERNGKGEHIAYWVRNQSKNNVGATGDTKIKDFDVSIRHERILARNKYGHRMAKMIYGSKARLDHVRGIPVITSILEKVTKLDRFVDASVDKAEKIAELVYSFEHDEYSTGENPLGVGLVEDESLLRNPEDDYEKSGRTAARLEQSTKGTVINNVPGSKLTSLSNDSEINFDQFYKAVYLTICASIPIPMEVALQRYEQNFSSSRAAINGWDFLVRIYRERLANDTYNLFYKVWLEVNILRGVIDFPQYLEIIQKNNKIALEAITSAEFRGEKMPHIDPLKEAKAVRSMLGDEKTPLMSREQASEALNLGEWRENFKKYVKETGIVKESLPEIDDDSKENNTE